MVIVNVTLDNKVVRTYKADDYEPIYECGYENVYIEKDGVRTKVVTTGDFGGGYWCYSIEHTDNN